MTERTAGRLAWSIALVCICMAAADCVLLYLNRAVIHSPQDADPIGIVLAITFATLGALVASRRSQNPIGWMLLGIAAIAGSEALTHHVAIRAQLVGVSTDGWLRWFAWVNNWAGSALGISLVTLMFLLFPDGKPLTRRWGWVVRATILSTIGFVVISALDPKPVKLSSGLASLKNPVGIQAMAGVANSPIWFLLFALLFIAAGALPTLPQI